MSIESFMQMKTETKRHHKLGYFSSPDRGLDIALDMWPKVKAAFPDATLDVCYGFDLFMKHYANNPERLAWATKLIKQMEVDPQITYHGKVGKKELQDIRKSCGIWFYPTHFLETNCISALDCAHDGTVPVVMNIGALQETVSAGVKIEGDIFFPEVQEKYLSELLSLMGDEKRWQEESEKAKEFAKRYAWPLIANKWVEVFKS